MSDYVRCVKDYAVLEANTECGEGSVRLSEAFYEQSHIWMADVLKDWIRQLEGLYQDTCERITWDDRLEEVSQTNPKTKTVFEQVRETINQE